MNDNFLNYNQSIEVKKLGFNEQCIAFYIPEYSKKENRLLFDTTKFNLNFQGNGDIIESYLISAPLKSQFFKWVREKYKLYPHIFSREDGNFVWCIRWYENGLQRDIPYESSDTYEQAEDACINKIIELLKKQ